MSEHYYTQNPTSAHDIRRIEVELDGQKLSFDTDAGVFSRDGLDNGTELLIRALPSLSGTVLDMGCGWGALGLFVKARNPAIELVACDVNERAVDLTRTNARLNNLGVHTLISDGFSRVEGLFDTIITNPPIRAGKKVIYQMFADAAQHLAPVGALYIVIQTKQGADSAKKYLEECYGNAEIISRGGGFKVIRAVNNGKDA